MRILFLGTPQFAVPSLQKLIAGGHDVCAVYTQPDRPKGRGNQVAGSPVKEAATLLAVPVYQPERIRRPDAFEQLRSLAADLMVVVGYGQIIPQTIIDLPPMGILNVHGSLLPRYRGAAPIQWAIANGEERTGVTIMQIDAGLDTGDMLLKAETPISPSETAPELGVRLADVGAELLLQAIDALRAGQAKAEKQDEGDATYAPILKKEDGRVDWSLPARQIYNRLRGFTPWPGAYSTFRGEPISFLKAAPIDLPGAQPGRLVKEKRRLLAGCGTDSALEVLELQLAGKKRMSAEAFLNGYKPALDETFGENQNG